MTIEGTWETDAKTPLGHMKGKLELKVDGTALSGTSTSKWGASEFSGGTVNGDEFEFKAKNKTPMGPMTVVYTGKVEGDTMSGMTTTKPMGLKTPFTGVRI